MRIAFFTHHFLEPTHYAIAQVIKGLKDIRFSVFSKRFTEECFGFQNINERFFYVKGSLPQLQSSKYDLVHAIFDGKTALRASVAAINAKLPYVLSFHGGFDTQAKIFDARYIEKTREIAQHADAITVVCQSDEIKMRKIGVTRPIDIVPVPIDLSLIPKDAIPQIPYSLVTVGRLIPKKGIDIALRVLTKLPNKYKLTIIGDGELHHELLELSKSLGIEDRVRWMGLLTLNETLRIMKSSTILIHPARVATDKNAEGNPQTILWAQAMGLPVITTATGSLSDIVEHNKSGILVKPEDPDAVANAVLALDSDPNLRQLIISFANTRAYERHSLTNVVNQFRVIYERVKYDKGA